MQSWKDMSVSLKLALGASLILALAIVGVLTTDRGGTENPDDATRARETGATKTGDDARATGKALELGTVAKISTNYRIAVTEIDRYAVPTGHLIAATIESTYIGKQDGEPWADLNVEFFGSGSRTFGQSDCPFALGELDPSGLPTLETGDDATYKVCLDLPVKSIKGGKLLVEEAFSTDDRTFWSTDEAVTKPLPPPPRRSSGQSAPGSQPQQQDNDDSSSSGAACDEDYEEDIEEYRDGIDDLDKLAEQADEDDQEEYEEWKDAMEKNIEQYEKYC